MLQQVSSSVVMAQTVPPGTQAGAQPPVPPAPSSTPGFCNSALPADSVLNRFMWTVAYFVQNGFYVILDNQFNKDQTAITNTAQWLQRVSCPSPRNPKP